MSFSINANHRLTRNGNQVERIASPAAHTSGAFAAIPGIIVMHFTYGASGRSSAEWFRNPQNTLKSSAHAVIDRDGSVIQCVNFDIAANHAGPSTWKGMNGLNTRSFGIELANWGYLSSAGPGWTSYTGVTIANPFMAIHKNGNPSGSPAPIGWEPYSDSQIAAAVGVARAIVDKYGADEIIGHDDISVGRKWDPGPAFDMTSFRTQVLEDQSSTAGNTRIVRSPEGLNLRKGPGTDYDVIVLLPDRTVVQPIGLNGSWVLANVLNDAGIPTQTGWLHSAFLN